MAADSRLEGAKGTSDPAVSESTHAVYTCNNCGHWFAFPLSRYPKEKKVFGCGDSRKRLLQAKKSALARCKKKCMLKGTAPGSEDGVIGKHSTTQGVSGDEDDDTEQIITRESSGDHDDDDDHESKKSALTKWKKKCMLKGTGIGSEEGLIGKQTIMQGGRGDYDDGVCTCKWMWIKCGSCETEQAAATILSSFH
jgi:hypothetical protein